VHDGAPRFPWLGLLVVALLTGLGDLRPVADPDTPWHLQQAAEVLRHKSIVYPDTTSFTVPGKEYANHPWLGELFMLMLFQLGGFAALSYLTAAAGFLSTILVGWAAWEYSERRPSITLLTTALVAACVSWRLGPRPLLLFLCFLPLGLVLARRFAIAEERRRVYLLAGALCLLQLVWIPSHGSYVLLPLVCAVSVTATFRAWGLGVALRRLGLAVALGLLILVFTDIGTHASLIHNVAFGDATSYIREMRPLRPARLVPTHINSILFLDLLLLLGLGRAFRRRGAPVEDVGLMLLGMALTLTAHRFRAAWALLSIPWAARPVPGEERPWLRIASILAVLVAVPALVANDVRRDPIQGFGPGLARDSFPVDSTSFLENIDAEGKLLNIYSDGGYLAFRLGPKVRIAIDGRTPTLFDDELYFSIRAAALHRSAFDAFVLRYAPDMILTDPARPVCRMLSQDPRWRAVFLGFDRALFFRSEFMTDIPGVEAVAPCDASASLMERCTEGRAAEMGQELAQMRRVVPGSPYLLTLESRLAGACLGDYRKAREFAEAALVSGSRRPEVVFARAQALAATKGWAEARDEAERAYALGAGIRALFLKARAQMELGEVDEALETYEGGARELGDRLSVRMRLEYAEALAAAGRREQAALHARRALWVSGSTRARDLIRSLSGTE
jgi:hypothetical protein